MCVRTFDLGFYERGCLLARNDAAGMCLKEKTEAASVFFSSLSTFFCPCVCILCRTEKRGGGREGVEKAEGWTGKRRFSVIG